MPNHRPIFRSTDGKGRCTWFSADTQPWARIRVSTETNWSLRAQPALRVRAGSQVQYGMDVRINSLGESTALFICLRLINARGAEVQALYAPLMPSEMTSTDWQAVSGRAVVPAGVTGVEVCVWCQGAASVDLRGFTLAPAGDVLKPVRLPRVRLVNRWLAVDVTPEPWHLRFVDRRNGQQWDTFPLDGSFTVRAIERRSASSLQVQAIYLPAAQPLTITLTLQEDQPAVRVDASMPADTPMPWWAAMLDVIPPFAMSGPQWELVVPYGDGFLFPTDDPGLPALQMSMGDGAGLTMPWFGVTNNRTGASVMVHAMEEADTHTVMYYRRQGTRAAGQISLRWMSSMGRWAYNRSAVITFADRGGYVRLADIYRDAAQAAGRRVTLRQKKDILGLPTDRLIGAPILWLHGLWQFSEPAQRLAYVRELYESGLDRAVLASSDALEDAAEPIQWGWLCGMYDLYTDLWPREQWEKAGVWDRDWGWPEYLHINPNGQPKRGWVQITQHGAFPAWGLCPTQWVNWARERVPQSLQKHRMNARLVDTVTALPLGECYAPKHRMTRQDDRAARMKLLQVLTDHHLVIGSEMGVDWAVPLLCYAEGLLAPVAFRASDSGRIFEGLPQPKESMDYQLNPARRIPLWGLIYRDCTVATWYWGDCNMTYPGLEHRRRLFNALTATPPMYMLMTPEALQKYRQLMLDDYNALKPVFEAVGDARMTDHQTLTPDRLVQRTTFDNGATVTVNFDSKPRRVAGLELDAESFQVKRA